MLDKLISFVEKIIEWNEDCLNKWCGLTIILSSPVLIIGMLIFKVIIILELFKRKGKQYYGTIIQRTRKNKSK